MTDVDSIPLFLNLLCHVTVFLSTFYVAMHNRFINPVILTMLWYVGLTSFFAGSTIVLEYVMGEEFAMSYSNLGIIAETLSNLAVAATLGIIFMLTVDEDFRAKTMRGSQQPKPQPKAKKIKKTARPRV